DRAPRAAPLGEILAYVERGGELDTTGVPATTHALEVENVFRDDEVVPSLERQQALANAPAANHEAFLVPRVI
ncbi:MAG: Asp-tRNA(Asn)/Glu-tRNA(Gln) amidotransferase subunit GatC, partial [Thermodesulfobacteriota bacterium]